MTETNKSNRPGGLVDVHGRELPKVGGQQALAKLLQIYRDDLNHLAEQIAKANRHIAANHARDYREIIQITRNINQRLGQVEQRLDSLELKQRQEMQS